MKKNKKRKKLIQEGNLLVSRMQKGQGFVPRLLMGFIFLLGLFFTLHLQEVRVEVLEIDSRAHKYIVAQVDFEYFYELIPKPILLVNLLGL